MKKLFLIIILMFDFFCLKNLKSMQNREHLEINFETNDCNILTDDTINPKITCKLFNKINLVDYFDNYLIEENNDTKKLRRPAVLENFLNNTILYIFNIKNNSSIYLKIDSVNCLDLQDYNVFFNASDLPIIKPNKCSLFCRSCCCSSKNAFFLMMNIICSGVEICCMINFPFIAIQMVPYLIITNSFWNGFTALNTCMSYKDKVNQLEIINSNLRQIRDSGTILIKPGETGQAFILVKRNLDQLFLHAPKQLKYESALAEQGLENAIETPESIQEQVLVPLPNSSIPIYIGDDEITEDEQKIENLTDLFNLGLSISKQQLEPVQTQ
ncbi:hypothetical protein K9L05_01075 [Candidatus Babeliales bacterium]|nr:hypothetical protein [Candidatus Babeliales bacterium]MCF7899224.1 hypothetical protein [Candidatus Babeliales bacterium]